MKKIKILYVIGSFTTGGVETFILNVCDNIDKNKFEIDFLLFEDYDLSCKYKLEKYNSKIIYIPGIKKGIFKFILNNYRVLKKYNYDIVHAHTNYISIFTAISGILAGTKVRICHSHNSEFKINGAIVKIVSLLYRILPIKLFACSNVAGKKLFGKKANIILINNAIDIEKFCYNEKIRRNVRKELGIENKFVIGNIARFSYQKNHSFLIDIFEKVLTKNKEAVLLLIGEGELEEEIRFKANKMGILDNVIFLGARTDVNEILQAIDIILFPSLYEGLGIVLIEAQCAGLPCIISDTIPKEAKVTGLVKNMSLKQNSQCWAEMLVEFYNNTSRKDISREIINSGYDIRSIVKKIENYYENFYLEKSK